MYRTSNVARLAGAAALLALLALWGLGARLLAGETTLSTWAIGFAVTVPLSALLVGVGDRGPPPRDGREYAVGMVAAVLPLSVAYVVAATADRPLTSALAHFDAPELVAAAVLFALLGGALALADLLYVERPETAAVLEARHLDEPLGD